MRIVLASRKSDLARIQAYQVGHRLQAAHPSLEIEYQFSESLGDKNQQDPLWAMPEKGVFTQDLKQALIRGDVDMVVHSWKDLPVDSDLETKIAATLPRADQRDLLLVKKSAIERIRQTGALEILTSSPRRDYHLKKTLPDLFPMDLKQVNCVPVRGNVPTRIRKLMEGSEQALVVAKAAWDRLSSTTEQEFQESKNFLQDCLKQLNYMVLPLSVFPTAAAQGALAVEIPADRRDLQILLQDIHDATTWECVERERQYLADYGGGCHAPMGFSVVPHSLGQIHILSGKNEQTGEFHQVEFRSRLEEPSIEELNPLILENDPEALSVFKREEIPYHDLKNEMALVVARDQALPKDVAPDNQRILWASGVKTWKKLAARGHWVSGTFDSLGEELPNAQHLIPSGAVWKKLSHDRSDDDLMELIPTYRLTDNPIHPSYEKANCFYWMSASSFERAVREIPQIRNAHHFCGLGKTYEAIKIQLGPHGKLFAEFSYEDWKNKMKRIKS